MKLNPAIYTFMSDEAIALILMGTGAIPNRNSYRFKFDPTFDPGLGIPEKRYNLIKGVYEDYFDDLFYTRIFYNQKLKEFKRFKRELKGEQTDAQEPHQTKGKQETTQG